MDKSFSLHHPSGFISADALFRWVDRLSDQLGLSVPPVTTRDRLEACPPGSLGRAWVDLIDAHHYPLLTSDPRRKQMHDAIHILTGYGTDDWGELEVQTFLLGCQFRSFHLPIMAGLLNRLWLKGQLTGAWRDRLWSAYERGVAATDTFDPDTWPAEYLLDMPIATAQDCLGILPQ